MKVPQHVTLKVRRHVWQLRSRRCGNIVKRALFAGCDRFGGRVAQFSIQHDHIHLVVEAGDRRALARVIQGLAIRIARGLNRVMGKRGKVFADRFHSRPLRTPTEVRAALVYVLNNFRKHAVRWGIELPAAWSDDEYSSSPWFEGWADLSSPRAGPAPVVGARTWLLSVGWSGGAGGRLRRDELPQGK